MILTETGSIPDSALPLTELQDHLQIGTVYASEQLQDDLLNSLLRAAISNIEQRTGMALILRGFSWELTQWGRPNRQILPIRPIAALTEVKLVDRLGVETVVDASDYVLHRDSQSPAIVPVGACLPDLPQLGTVLMNFDAGFGLTWDEVPNDLARAAVLQASDFYENRHSADAAAMSQRILDMLEPYRRVRIFGGV